MINVLKENIDNIKGYGINNNNIVIPVVNRVQIGGYSVEQVKEIISDIENGYIEVVRVVLNNGEVFEK